MQHVVKLRDIEYPKTDVNVTTKREKTKTKNKQTKETKQKMLHF